MGSPTRVQPCLTPMPSGASDEMAAATTESVRTSLPAERGYNPTRVTRSAGRDLAGGRAADQRNPPRALVYAEQKLIQVVALGAEDDQELCVFAPQSLVGCVAGCASGVTCV